jgi:hypothetical protein
MSEVPLLNPELLRPGLVMKDSRWTDWYTVAEVHGREFIFDGYPNAVYDFFSPISGGTWVIPNASWCASCEEPALINDYLCHHCRKEENNG